MPPTPTFSAASTLVKDSHRLTNAGSLLFVETPWPGVDYIRRDMPGGDSTLRVEGAGPLLTQVYKVSAGKLLTALPDAGHLDGSRPERIGRGFFYVPASSGENQRNVTGTR